MAKDMVPDPKTIRRLKRPHDRLINSGVLLEHLYKRLLETPPEEPSLMTYARALGEPPEVLSAIRIRNCCVHDPHSTTVGDVKKAAEILYRRGRDILASLAKARATAIAYNPVHRIFRFVVATLFLAAVLNDGFGLTGPLSDGAQWFGGLIGLLGIAAAIFPSLHSLGGLGAVNAYGPEILKQR